MQRYIIILVLLVIFVIYFNRDAEVIKIDDTKFKNIVIKPSDGTLEEIIETEKYIELHWFLGLFDIHTQYIPIDGRVIKVERIEGKYCLAKNNNKIHKTNKRIITTMSVKDKINGEGLIMIEQIAGLLTPTITNNLQENQEVKRSDKIGKIYLGSHCVLHLPKTHYKKELIKEKVGEHFKPTAIIYQE